MLASLELNNWRQFKKINIQFHHRLTILTGRNGSGKTTILNIINGAFGFSSTYVATAERDNNGNLSYFCGFYGTVEPKDKESSLAIIGKITYTDIEHTSTLTVPVNSIKNSATFNINATPLYNQKGFYIPSHRTIFVYESINQLPTKPIDEEQIFREYNYQTHLRYTANSGNKKSATIIKEALLSFAIHGYGSEVVLANPKAKSLFEKIQSMLKKILPPDLGFEKILIEMPEVLLVTKTGKIPLDSLSGGISAIMEVAWQIFMFSTNDESFVVIIDEPENHLHPEMQQKLLPTLLEIFPHVQFIIATHNPLIISSVIESNIYVLDYNKDSKIESQLLDFANKAGTANQVLREVLGLPFTVPLWADKKLKEIVDKYVSLDLNKDNFSKLRQELKANGLEDFIPNTIAKVVSEVKND